MRTITAQGLLSPQTFPLFPALPTSQVLSSPPPTRSLSHETDESRRGSYFDKFPIKRSQRGR